MSDKEPTLRLSFGDSEFETTRDNTALYTFLGRSGVSLAHYDHVFLKFDEESNTGAYIFCDSPAFETIANFAIENNYPLHINLAAVPECDEIAYDKHIAQLANDLDSLPDGWDDGTTDS